MSVPVHAPRARRSRARRIALIVWVVVFLAVAIPTILSVVSYSSRPEDQRVPAAGGDVTISEPGRYSVYAETTQGSPGRWAAVASVTAPSGAPVPVRASGFNENYNYGSRVATRVGTFTATETGTYRVVGQDDGTLPGDELVISTRTVGSILGLAAGAVATGVVLVVGLVVGLVMLLAGRRRLPPPPAYGPPAGPGPYGGPPQPGPYGPGPYGTPPSAGPPQPRPPEQPTVTVHPAEPPRQDDRP